MYDTKMNRMTARVTFGRDYRDRPAPEAEKCPEGGSKSTGPRFETPADRARARRWWKR